MMGSLNIDPFAHFLWFSALLKYSVLYIWRDRRPKNAEYVGRVSELTLYPVKSARGINVQEFVCDFKRGPHVGHVTDRHWQIAGDDYVLLNGKTEPRLALLKPEIQGSVLTLNGPGMEPLVIDSTDVVKAGQELTTVVHSVSTKALHCGQNASKWISKYLGKSAHLLYSPPEEIQKRSVRKGTVKYAAWTKTAKEDDQIAFQDVTPFMLMSQDSLDDLNSKLETRVGMDRFRGNIVCHGSRPYDEDNWKELFIGEIRCTTMKLCGRCLFVTVDTETGTKHEREEPLRTLRSYRNVVSGFGPCLGINMVLDRPGTVRVGDPIYAVRGDNTKLP